MVSKVQVIKTEDFETSHQICRLCLSTESLEHIFKEENLHLWISDFLSIMVSVDDRMSQAICAICRIRLIEFQEFRMRCQHVQHVLRLTIQEDDGPGTNQDTPAQSEQEEETTQNAQPIECKTYREKLKVKTSSKLRCSMCGKRFSTSKRYESHMKYHSLAQIGNKIQFQCEVCPSVFTGRKQLRDHYRIHGPRKHVCTLCGASYPIRQYLKKHMRSHAKKKYYRTKRTNLDEKGSKVESDSISNNINHNESIVQTTIENQGPIVSDVSCSKEQYKNEDDLIDKPVSVYPDDSLLQHDRPENGYTDSNAKLFDEPECEESVYEGDSIVLEEVKIEPDSDDDATELPFALPNEVSTMLNAVKANSQSMADPKQTSKQRPRLNKKSSIHQCDVCQKVFPGRKALTDHWRVVHGPKNHVCVVCGFKFSLWANLRRHMRRQHDSKAQVEH